MMIVRGKNIGRVLHRIRVQLTHIIILETYTIASIAATGLTRSSDFDDLPSFKSIVACDRIGKLDPW